MMKKCGQVFILLFVSACSLIDAQTSGRGNTKEPSNLTQSSNDLNSAEITTQPQKGFFHTAIAQAVRNSPEVRKALVDLKQAQNIFETKQKSFRPSVGAGVDANSRSTIGATKPSQRVTPYLEVSQVIFDGGSARRAERAAELDLKKSNANAISTLANTSLEAVSTWINLSAAHELNSIHELNVDRHGEFVQLIEARSNAGVGSLSDLLTAQSRSEEAQGQFLDAQMELATAEAEFIRLFGDVPDPLPPLPKATSQPLPQDSSKLDNSRLRSVEFEILTAQERLAETKSKRWPKVVLTGRAQPTDDGNPEAILNLGAEYSFDTQSQYSSAILSADAEIDRLKEKRASIELDLSRSLKIIKSQKAATSKHLKIAQTNVQSGQQRVAAAQEEFSIGRAELINVLDAQRDLVRAQLALISIKTKAHLLDYQALAITNQILTEFGLLPFYSKESSVKYIKSVN